MAGNKNSGRHNSEKPFRDMIALAVLGAKGDKGRLRRIAEQLVSKAEAGEPWAIKEVADRIDGKAHQSTDTTLDVGDSISDLLRQIAENGNRANQR